MLEVGINSNNECGNSNIEILNNIKSVGFNNVMVAFKVGDAEEMLKNAIKIGLKVPFVHLTSSNAIWAIGESNKDYVNNIKQQLKICNKYNIGLAVLHPTKGNADELALPPNENGLESVREILNFAKTLGIKIALENLDKVNFQHFEYLMQNIDDPSLGFCYDIGHHQLYNPDIDLLEKYGHRLLAVHIHDNLMDWSFGYDWTRDLHQLPFDGKIDYDIFCKKLADLNYSNVVMLEVHRKSCGEPRLYKDISPIDFLKEAKLRAEKLAKIIEKGKKAN